MFIWILINLFFLVVLFFFISVNIINLVKMPRLEQYSNPADFPSVSIIIPARNEARNIARCVSSLLAQDYPDCEIIVVNDNSTDDTARILQELQAGKSCLKVINGRPLPKGWAGKNWAVHQGYLASRGKILLFTDADTVHRHDTTKKAVAALIQENADFLTALPSQSTGSFGEKAVIPKTFWIVYSIFPFAYLNKLTSPATAFGIGQFMMYTRKAYELSGGYESIRNIFFDDMTMARQIKKKKLKSLVIDGSAFITCRMYFSWREVYHGLARTIYPLVRYSLPHWLAAPLYTLGMLFLCFTFLTPVLTIIACLTSLMAGFMVAGTLWILSALGIGFSYITYSLVYFRFKFPLYMILLYPLNVIAFQIVAFGSLILAHLGKLVWKDRFMDVPG